MIYFKYCTASSIDSLYEIPDNIKLKFYFEIIKATTLPATTPPYNINAVKQEQLLQHFSSFLITATARTTTTYT